MGAANNNRLQDRIQEASSDCLHRKNACRQKSRGLLFPNVSSAKEGWWTKTSYKPKTTQSVVKNQTFQDGRHPHAKKPAKSRRLIAKIDLKDAYFSHRETEISLNSNGKTKRRPTVQAVFSSMGLYQDYKASCGNPVGVGTEADNLYRQYPCLNRDRVSTQTSCYSSDISAGESKICDQLLNSTKMELKLPGEKIKKIRTEVSKVHVLQSHSVSGLTRSRLIGETSAAIQVIPMAPFTCILQEPPN